MKANTLPEAQRPLFEKIVPTAVEVRKLAEDGDGCGSGVVISADGLILTAYHVITRSRVVKVRRLLLERKRWILRTYGTYKADVIFRDKKADIAVLKLRKPPEDLAVAKLGDSDAIALGTSLFRVGRDDIPLASGYVCALGHHERFREISVGMFAQPGSSGGPAFDDEGRFVGVCLRYQSEPEQPPIAYVLPLSTIKSRVAKCAEAKHALEVP
jgi:S1-C subfamily serine protease